MNNKQTRSKSIHLLHHSISALPDQFPEGDPLHYNSGIPMLFARAIRKYYPQLDVEVWRPEKSLKQPYIWTDNDNIIHRVFPSYYLKYKVELSPSLLQKLAEASQSNQAYFWVHGIYNFHSFLFATRLKESPVIAQSHGGFPGKTLFEISAHRWRKFLYLLLHPIERKRLPQYPHIFAISSEEKEHICSVLPIPEQQVSFSPTGIDFDLFSPGSRTEARARCGIDSQTKMLLFVGRLSEVKGIEYLLEAFGRLQTQFANIKLFLVGDGPLKKTLLIQAQQLGIADKVQFLGYISPDELPYWYRAADVTVVPSFFEWFGKVSVESMACGTPIVVTERGGGADIVKEFECGLLVPLRNAGAMAEAIGKIISGSVNTQPNITRGRNRFDWRAKLSHSFALFDEMARQKQPAHE